MKGKYPIDYFKNPYVNKPIEDIWDDIDAYSGEFFEDEPDFHNKIDFIIPLPPLKYKGVTTKGIVFSQGAEYLLKLHPQLQEIFFVTAYTMWSSYSWSEKADVYMTCYKNEPRELYYKNKYPNKKDKIFVPLQDADFTNEYKVAPTFNTPKTVDVICVSTPMRVKNLPMLAQALKIYEKKYGRILNTTLALGNRLVKRTEDGKIDYSALPESQKEQMRQVEEILGDISKYINVYPYIENKELPRHYSSAKCCVLTSLIEGKNRSLSEARSCNTPVIAFRDHNKWARGDFPIFMGNSGELVDRFTPEALADTIHKVITNQDAYEPRRNYLKYHGRKNFINTFVDTIPYYAENLPEYVPGKIHENLWVDLAMQENYQLSFYQFLYGQNPAIQHVRGLKDIDNLVKFFYSRFGINA